MKTFRKIIFWMHLAAGLSAGIVIFIMCVTGALLAFEKNVIEWVESGSRNEVVDTRRGDLKAREALVAVLEAKPGSRPSSLAMTNDPSSALAVSLGREGQVFVDPHTAAIVGESSAGVRSFFRTVTDLHRFIAMSGDTRPIGKGITGASNLIFLFIAVSGIYIWMPRNLNWSLIKPVVWFRGGLRGKARNFNWHNTIGFWTSLFLIVFTLTATVISYQWASNLLFTLTGNQVPTQQTGPANNSDQAEQPFVVPENLNAIWQTAEDKAPGWKSISLRLPIEKDAAVFTVDEGIYWNIFGRSTLTITTQTAEITKWEPYGERNSAQQLRTWFRFTHTGETGGIVGQIIGFIACVGGAFLVWTGFSLAFRRFGKWMKNRSNGRSA